MNRLGLLFHHLGLAVKTPEIAERFLAGLGYSVEPRIYDPLQNVWLGMSRHPNMPAVEIISPGSAGGPLDKLLKTHEEGLVYHMCYRCGDLPATLGAIEGMEGMRLSCVSSPKAAVLFDGMLVSFYSVKGMGLIEIIEDPSMAL
jgi:methylmalonyl-CoA/ethylmalonyl-CoA epimerase